MTPRALAELHAQCFTVPRPWSEAEFANLLESPGVFVVAEPQGFALGRTVLDEAELLTLAVAPDARRGGIGRALLARFEQCASERGATKGFLEVAADNRAARGLYTAQDWLETGLRPRYFRAPDGTLIDAIIMGKSLEFS